MSSSNNYTLLDIVLVKSDIYLAIEINPFNKSLYQNDLIEISPFLFDCTDNFDFNNWYLKNGWGAYWGIIMRSKMPFDEVLKHLKNFSLVKTEDNQQFYFRFYDPRVLKIFLPTCDKSQILEFFGPIESFICEGDTKEEAIRFWQENGELKQEILPTEKIFGEIKITESTNQS